VCGSRPGDLSIRLGAAESARKLHRACVSMRARERIAAPVWPVDLSQALIQRS